MEKTKLILEIVKPMMGKGDEKTIRLLDKAVALRMKSLMPMMPMMPMILRMRSVERLNSQR